MAERIIRKDDKGNLICQDGEIAFCPYGRGDPEGDNACNDHCIWYREEYRKAKPPKIIVRAYCDKKFIGRYEIRKGAK